MINLKIYEDELDITDIVVIDKYDSAKLKEPKSITVTINQPLIFGILCSSFVLIFRLFISFIFL